MTPPKSIEERLAVIESQHAGGAKAFDAIRVQAYESKLETMARIEKIEEKIMPKAIEWAKLFGIVLIVGGIVYGTGEKFSTRPRFDQVHDMIEPLNQDQDRTSDLVRKIEINQRELATSIKSIEAAQQAQSRKLDELLTPKRRR